MHRIALALCLASAAVAQTAESTLAFEAASVKSSGSVGLGMSLRGGPGTNSPGQFTCTNVPLRVLMLRAYGVRRYQISGPAWIDTAGFDIAAKIPPSTTESHFVIMLRNLLSERFGLLVHRETKEMPLYELIVAKGGHKMKGAEPEQPSQEPPAIKTFQGKDGFPISPAAMGIAGAFPFTMAGKAKIDAVRVSMDSFARSLADTLGMPVVNATNLTGNYAFAVYYTPEGLPASTEVPVPLASDPGAQTIFSALQDQLGLKLDARKGPLEMVMIDRVEKTPTRN